MKYTYLNFIYISLIKRVSSSCCLTSLPLLRSPPPRIVLILSTRDRAMTPQSCPCPKDSLLKS